MGKAAGQFVDHLQLVLLQSPLRPFLGAGGR